MATYDELRALFADDDLGHRVRVAVVIAAQAQLQAGPGTIEGRAWALEVLNDPKDWGGKVLLSVLAENKGLTIAQITGASDSAIQTAVDAVVPALIGAISGT